MKKGIIVLSIVFLSCLMLVACIKGGKSKVEYEPWPESGIALKLPVPAAGKFEIGVYHDSAFLCDVHFDDDTADAKAHEYIEECKKMGYTIEPEVSNTTYRAFNNDGYKVYIYWSSSHKDEYTIDFDAPEKLETISWPTRGLASLIPTPKSTYGKFSRDSSENFGAYIGNTSKEELGSYMDECYDAGYSIDYDKSDDYYSAKNADGISLTLEYEGFNIFYISIKAPKDSKIEYESNDSQKAPDTQGPSTQDTAETNDSKSSSEQSDLSDDTIRPTVKAAIDSYEEFIKQYCDFMRKYDSSDVNMLLEYTKLLAKKEEMEIKNALLMDDELTLAEIEYYNESSARCSQMLIDLSLELSSK